MKMIRSIKEDDLLECVSVIKTSFATVANDFALTKDNAPRFTAFSTDYNRLNWHLSFEQRQMYGFFVDDKMVGYYSLSHRDSNECELNNLCILPEFRHRKRGSILLNHSFDVAKQLGYTRMFIGIIEDNTVLKNWYEKNGFILIETKKYDFFPFTCGYLIKVL